MDDVFCPYFWIIFCKVCSFFFTKNLEVRVFMLNFVN